jgi:hypothetical protein
LLQKREPPAQALLALAALLARAWKQGFALLALDCSLEPARPAGGEREPARHLRLCERGCTRSGSGRDSRRRARRASASAGPRASPPTCSSGSGASGRPVRAWPRSRTAWARLRSRPPRRAALVSLDHQLHARASELRRSACRLVRETRHARLVSERHWAGHERRNTASVAAPLLVQRHASCDLPACRVPPARRGQRACASRATEGRGRMSTTGSQEDRVACRKERLMFLPAKRQTTSPRRWATTRLNPAAVGHAPASGGRPKRRTDQGAR